MSSYQAAHLSLALALCSGLVGCPDQRSSASGAQHSPGAPRTSLASASTTVAVSATASAAAPAPQASALTPPPAAALAKLPQPLTPDQADPLIRAQARFSPDGSRLLFCCNRRAAAAGGGHGWTAQLWDLKQGRLAGTLDHDDETSRTPAAPFVRWSPTGQYIVISYSHDVAVWHAKTLRRHWAAPADYGAYAIDPTDTRVVWGRSNEDTFLIDLARGTQLKRNEQRAGTTGLLVDLDWSPDGRHALVDGLIWSNSGGTSASWQAATKTRWPNDQALDWQWGASGKLLLVATDGKLTAMDVARGGVAWQQDRVEPPIALHAASELLAFIEPGGKVGLLNTQSRKLTASFTDTAPPADSPREQVRYQGDAIRFSADGRQLLVQRTFEPVRICDVAKRACLRLSLTTGQNAAPPIWRGREVYLQAQDSIVGWSPDAAKRWHLLGSATAGQIGFDVSPDGLQVALATADAAYLVRLRDRRVVRLTARLDGAALVGELTPAHTDVLEP